MKPRVRKQFSPEVTPSVNVFNTPPVQVTRERASTRDIHDDIAHREEHFRCEGLCEKNSKVCRTLHERYGNVVCFNALAHEEVSPVDVLR
eukprot:6189037-Pleurochrysis_carterae.AAC.1